MIIQSARLSTGTDLPKLTGHVFAGAANDAITVLHGVQDDLDGMQQDAAAAKKPYAIRHFKIAPAETTDRVEAADVMRDLAREFGFALAHCVIVEHAKPRQPGGYEYHWHLLVPEWDPARRRVLDNKWARPRQEKIARRAEARLGHALVAGRWNAAVARRLEEDGQSDLAAAMAGLRGPASANRSLLGGAASGGGEQGRRSAEIRHADPGSLEHRPGWAGIRGGNREGRRHPTARRQRWSGKRKPTATLH
jgi:hypothetical protein